MRLARKTAMAPSSITSPTPSPTLSSPPTCSPAIEPALVVKYSDNLVDGRVYVLEPGHDYTVSYENNVEVGTATVVVKAGTSGNYRGEVKATFSIVGTTAILAVGGSPAGTTAQRYTLGGRQASATKKGVVIVDGKKVVVK